MTPRILVTHGRDQAFQIPARMQRDWADALRFGLESVGAPRPAEVPIDFAFYGDLWRPDRRTLDAGERGDEQVVGTEAIAAALDAPPTALQAEIASELLPAGEDGERLAWDRLTSVVRALDQAFGVGELVLTRFLADLDEYFERPEIRDQTLAVLRKACVESDRTVLLGHSMGSIVAYDLLASDGAESLGIEALVTFGSPLGMGAIRRRIAGLHGGSPFPNGLRAWSNVYNVEDFATAVRELAPLFSATDGRAVRDVAAMGRRPTLGDPGRGHDPITYLSSIGLAGEVWRLLIGERAAAARPDVLPEAGSGPVRGLPIDLERGDDVATPTMAEPPAAEPEPAEPSAVPSGPSDAGIRTVERSASADFPPTVAPGSTHDLIFSIAAQAVHARATPLRLSAPVEQRTLVLRVGVYAAGFDVAAADDPSRTWTDVTVDLDDTSRVAEGRFRLTAHQSQERRETPIYLTFYRGNLPVGQLTLLTVIDPIHEVRRAAISVPIGGATDPDYVLVVADRSDNIRGAGPFDIYVSKEGEFLNRPLGSFPVTVDAWEYASRRLEGFRSIHRETDPAERIRAAENLGVEIWQDLPEPFQRFYWEELHHRPGASIAIYSQEPYIPWELIKPRAAPGRTAGFLGTTFNIARWKQATRFPDPLVIQRFSIIAPVYEAASGVRPLPGAQLEADELSAEFGADRIAGDRKTVRNLLESEEGVQVLHFAGHGDFDPQDSAAKAIIRLSDAPLEPGDLSRATIGQASRPFVFLNACEVGEQGWALTRIGGWAEAFTDVGFSGFIGPYWAVNDRVARKAAVLFYRSLASGRTVGEAVREIRLRFYADEEDTGHPSWLAYTLHCQPNIHIRWGAAPEPTSSRPAVTAADAPPVTEARPA